MTDLLIEHDMASKNLADLVRAGFRPRTDAHRRSGRAGTARVATNPTNDRRPVPATFQITGTLDRLPRELPRVDEHGVARLRQLDERLAVIERTFPGMESDIQLCRLTCATFEGIWQARVQETRTTSPARCACTLCSRLPVPPRRDQSDYRWRKSEGIPLAVKIWPYRSELDTVLTSGWLWTRILNDHTFGLDLRKRYEDDILVFHEYKRVATAIDIEQTGRSIKERLSGSTGRFDTNGARALISGLFASHKRSVDEYWIRRHLAGTVRMPQSIPIDVPAYSLLQLFDCLLWHFSPDAERWRAEILAVLVLSCVLNDMTDARADAVTGEINSLWLTSVPTHDKTLLGAAAIAAVKYSCMPEAHGHVWNSWLMPATTAWQGLTGRHALWFDGITDGFPPADDCPLCGIQPEACAGLLSGGVTLRTGPQPATRDLSPAANLLSERCRVEYPQAWSLFHAELAAFEGLHGRWQGDVDNVWTILRRTYIAAVIASLNGGAEDVAREIQVDSGAVGAEQFHRLAQLPTGTEDTALLGYMFGCAHPHFLWNCLGYQDGTVSGDWLDG